MHGAPLTAKLIQAGNLPADERRRNEQTRTRIGRALYELAFSLTAWTDETEGRNHGETSDPDDPRDKANRG